MLPGSHAHHHLAAQGVDDMTIVDDMAMFAVWLRSSAPQGDDVRGALEAFEAVVIKTHAQSVTDQAGGDRIKHLAQREGAGCRDVDVDLLISAVLRIGSLFSAIRSWSMRLALRALPRPT